jgi:hypothetical protein
MTSSELSQFQFQYEFSVHFSTSRYEDSVQFSRSTRLVPDEK